MSNCQHIGIVAILAYNMVFVGPNYDAGVGLSVSVDFLLCLDPVSPSYSKTHSRRNSSIPKRLRREMRRCRDDFLF
jgi:hypothetical protein